MVISHLVGYFSCHARQTHSLLCWIGFHRLKHQWDRSWSALKWCDGYECALEVILCLLHLYNAGKAGSCVSVVCSYSLHALVKWMMFSICSMVVDDVHFLYLFLFSSCFGFGFGFAWFDDIEWVKMNEISFENEQTSWTSIFIFFFQRVREMQFSLVSQVFRHSSNDIFESMSIYSVKMEMKWKSTNCLQIGNVFKWATSVMNAFSGKVRYIYSLKSNQIKSNHTFQYHISHIFVNTIMIFLNLSEWRKI